MAKAFEFRFETLLGLRRRHEDECKRVVAARLRALAEQTAQRETMLARIEEQVSQTREALREGALDVDALKLSRHWVLRLRRGIMDCDAAIERNRLLLVRERQALAEAAKNTKVLVRLKERRQAEYLAEMNRREQIELDEISVIQHGRQIMAGEVDS